MSETLALYGVGQLGRLFGAGFLALGHAVRPIRRATSEAERATILEGSDRVLVAVGEEDLASVLLTLPTRLKRGRTLLLQNELLPPSWRAAGVEDPTVLVVWSEKKKGKPLTLVDETRIAGPDRALAVRALAEVDVSARPIEDHALEEALVDKNLYILVSNFAGLRLGGTVGELARSHQALTEAIASEVLSIEGARLGRTFTLEPFFSRLLVAFMLDPTHGCRGRTAEARLARARAHAAQLGIPVPLLDSLAASGAALT